MEWHEKKRRIHPLSRTNSSTSTFSFVLASPDGEPQKPASESKKKRPSLKHQASYRPPLSQICMELPRISSPEYDTASLVMETPKSKPNDGTGAFKAAASAYITQVAEKENSGTEDESEGEQSTAGSTDEESIATPVDEAASLDEVAAGQPRLQAETPSGKSSRVRSAKPAKELKAAGKDPAPKSAAKVGDNGDGDSETELNEAHLVGFFTSRVRRRKQVQMESELDEKDRIVLSYWQQMAQESVVHKKAPDKEEIKLYVDRILKHTEVDNKEKVKQEVHYILSNFRQRRCIRFEMNKESFFHRSVKVLKKKGINIGGNRKYCRCGLELNNHTKDALEGKTSNKAWTVSNGTEAVHPWNFGNLDVPGHYNYLETPGGTKKYLRLDDLRTDPRCVWELLTKHWDLAPPNLVISITGGDISLLKENVNLFKKFQDGIMRCSVKTKAWLITDGMAVGMAREIGEMFQEDLRRSEYSEIDDHTSIPLIGIAPWGVLADRYQLQGIHVGSDEASYYFSAVQKVSNTSESVPNALDPYHVVYLFSDDGTAGKYKNEPRIRRSLERYIKHKTKLQMLGAKDVKTPLVILVVGGDRFTLEKVADATHKNTQIPVVIVNGSGKIANMLATVYKALEHKVPRSEDLEYGWSDKEEQILQEHMERYRQEGLLKTGRDQQHLKDLMTGRHLIEVFGIEDTDVRNLDKAILTAIFGGISDVSVQLFLTLAMDRYDIAREAIFIESRKEELRNHSEMLQQALLIAMKSGRSDFVQLLLDQDYGGELNEFDKFLTVGRLYTLHMENLNLGHIMGKVLRSLCKRDVYGNHMLGENQLLPQVGRVLYHLMGDHYRLLYQEKSFRQVTEDPIPWQMTSYKKEEGVWHLFLWAVLANRPEVAELFLFECSCKIGAALVAFKIFHELAKVAEKLAEVELQEDLKANAEYFQDLAMQTLDNLYEFKRDEAYASLVAIVPFHWGRYVTPLAIADDAGAMRFMSHACCQTFLNLVWMKYMDLDTPKWKLFPLMAFLPLINISFIVFDKRNLSFGSYKQQFIEEEAEEKQERERLTSLSHPREGSITSMRSTEGHVNEAYHTDDGDSLASIENKGLSFKKPSWQKPVVFKRIKFAWFCLKNYYTAPVNKFVWYMVSYLCLLGIFTHFLLTELAPVSSASEITVYEWLVMIWVFCISVEEFTQLFARPTSGPLYRLHWTDLEPAWTDTWYWHERLAFVLRFYRIKLWLSDRWNKVDALMMACFYASVILRFTLNHAHFGLVRVFYSVTLMIFYLRVLRIGYILQDIGPRIVTIKAMLKDLFQFMLILAVFIISFGVAFQALLDPNKSPSWDLLVDILWRPYWQMYGELFIEDATDGMGRDPINRTCTYDRKLAEANPDTMRICYNWTVPILLGVYMLITNILLLNLLIAIFSHSFELIESEALTIWRYHLYDLVHEYYYQVWLPPPLNLLCHFTNFAFWLAKWPRIWCYLLAKRQHRKDIQKARMKTSKLFAVDVFWGSSEVDKLAEEQMAQDTCAPFYFNRKNRHSEDINHFVQQEYMRDEDLEEKAYKRYLRSKKKNKENKIQKLLSQHNTRLLNITSELQDLKQSSRESINTTNASFQHAVKQLLGKRPSKSVLTATDLPSDSPSPLTTADSGELQQLRWRMDSMDSKVGGIQERMDILMEDIELVLDQVRVSSGTSRKSSASRHKEKPRYTKSSFETHH